jgi:hypothetical protein
MTDEDRLLLSLKQKLGPSTDDSSHTYSSQSDLLSRLLKTTSQTPDTVHSDKLINSLKQNLDPKTSDKIDNVSDSDSSAPSSSRLLQSIQQANATANRIEEDRRALADIRARQEDANNQAILDQEYALLQQEMGQIDDMKLINIAFTELVGSYESLSNEKKIYIISRIEEIFPTAIKQSWFRGKSLISTNYISRLFDTDDKKIELIRELSAYK